MTERLYYADAYLTEFDARVESCEVSGNLWRVRLDRSAFYPTSGGQPFDTGTLGGARVVDVAVEADEARFEEIMERVEKVCRRIEPDCRIVR